MEYAQFFRRLTGNEPYAFQARLAQLLFEGRSVILRAPTGAGKTWAAAAPFLFRLEHGKPLADRLLYALPLRSLATSLHEEVFERWNALRPGLRRRAQDRDYDGGHRYCCLQMGGQRDDPFLQGDAVFTTIDQVLSSYLMHPVSLSPKLDNINAGALIGAFLVFDEVHLLDARTSLGTTIEMLHRLHTEGSLCQFVLMTATLSDRAMAHLAEELKADVATIADDEIRRLPAYAAQRRSWRWRSEPLTAPGVIKEYSGGRCIVLANTVDRAQGIYRGLRRHWSPGSGGPQLLLLHSRFFPEDRRRKEERLKPSLGPGASASDSILVATQVIEAGMDISAELLLTELAPMNSLIQRAGRCARYPHRNAGEVVVFDLEEDGPSPIGSLSKRRRSCESDPRPAQGAFKSSHVFPTGTRVDRAGAR